MCRICKRLKKTTHLKKNKKDFFFSNQFNEKNKN